MSVQFSSVQLRRSVLALAELRLIQQSTHYMWQPHGAKLTLDQTCMLMTSTKAYLLVLT